MFKQENKFIEVQPFLTIPFLSKYNIFCAFTSRSGGYSGKPFDSLNTGYHVGDKRETVKNNRQFILNNIVDSESQYIYSARQVHGNNMLFVRKNTRHIDGAIQEEADSLMTCLKDTPIMVMGADCSLILIVDIGKGTVCAVHAGWKGTFNKILEDSLNSFCDEFNSKKKEICVFFGPCIRRCCYNIDNALADKFRNKFGNGKYLYEGERGPSLIL